jgi:serine/threonine protein kinase
VHRDIKPANILLSLGEPEDRAYVADFGLALKTGDVQLASQLAGTPA